MLSESKHLRKRTGALCPSRAELPDPTAAAGPVSPLNEAPAAAYTRSPHDSLGARVIPAAPVYLNSEEL
jgi:hypothetical protein